MSSKREGISAFVYKKRKKNGEGRELTGYQLNSVLDLTTKDTN